MISELGPEGGSSNTRKAPLTTTPIDYNTSFSAGHGELSKHAHLSLLSLSLSLPLSLSLLLPLWLLLSLLS